MKNANMNSVLKLCLFYENSPISKKIEEFLGHIIFNWYFLL